MKKIKYFIGKKFRDVENHQSELPELPIILVRGRYMLIFCVWPYTTIHSQRILAYTQDRTNFENTPFKIIKQSRTTHLQACLYNTKESYGHACYKTTQMESHYIHCAKENHEGILRKAGMR